MDIPHTILILGSDMNAYYMARSAHELYGKKVDLMGKRLLGVTKYSRIINFIQVPGIYEADAFVGALNQYAKQFSVEKIVLVATNDAFVRLIAENKDRLDSKFVHNHPSLEIVDTLLVKDKFYTAYSDELDFPRTLVYSCAERSDIKDAFRYPVVLKPGDGVDYYTHPFPGQAKAYKLDSLLEINKVVADIQDAGYRKNLIIQEFVPGDDTAIFQADMYVTSGKKTVLSSFSQIGIQERTPTGVGNCTVLVNGFDEHGYPDALVEKLGRFLEKIGYQGFAVIDFKYDHRDGTYKVFEINPRQGRSGYHLAGNGHNFIKYLVDDLIYGKEFQPVVEKREFALSYVPKYVIERYVASEPLLAEIKKLIKEGRFVRPLHYKPDMTLKRRIYLFLKDINYILKYRKLEW